MAIRLSGGTIRTLDPRRPTATSLTVEGDHVAQLDATADGAVELDLGGRCVLPGFTDAHVHFATWAIGLEQIGLQACHSLESALARVAQRSATAPPGAWLRGMGWRDADWTSPPTAAALDAVVGDRPVALVSRDYHSLWLSSAGLARADGALDHRAGVVERDADGRPTGILREEAAWQFRDRHLRPTPDEMERATEHGLSVAATHGVTSVHDKDGWLGILPVWQSLHARGALTLRVWQSLPHHAVGALRELGITSGFGDDWLRVGYLKAFMDGALGSGTARMLDGTGVALTSRAELETIVERASAAGFPVAVHAIGDGANRAALDAFEATRSHWAPRGLTPRIEHAQILANADVPRFAALGVAASVQFSHQTADRDLADARWPEITDRAYAWRSLVASGAVVVNGSDAPVEPLEPLAGLVAAVARSDDARPAWHPEQRLDVSQALEAICVAGPRLAGAGARRGQLVEGADADLVVLSSDPMHVAPEALVELSVEATMVGGRWTFPGSLG